jgi:hypothetical protein
MGRNADIEVVNRGGCFAIQVKRGVQASGLCKTPTEDATENKGKKRWFHIAKKF